uniref:Pectinesterase inhibitor domain-containing protein n=1 Tax=Panagrolaimus sp. PS1159 TaxID=55785 RepID=A0AC35G235_9BILA
MKLLICVIFLTFAVGVFGKTWDTSNFPNPTKRGECIVEKNAYLCDPDMLISPSGREKVVKALNDLEKNSRNQSANSFCDKKGVTAAIAAGKEFKGTQKELDGIASDLYKKWKLDSECEKSFVLVRSGTSGDAKYAVEAGKEVPMTKQEIQKLFKKKSPSLLESVLKVIEAVEKKAQEPKGAKKGLLSKIFG